MGNKTNHWIDTNTIGYVIILGKFTGFQFATHILLTRYLAIINGVNNSNSIAQSELTKKTLYSHQYPSAMALKYRLRTVQNTF